MKDGKYVFSQWFYKRKLLKKIQIVVLIIHQYEAVTPALGVAEHVNVLQSVPLKRIINFNKL